MLRVAVFLFSLFGGLCFSLPVLAQATYTSPGGVPWNNGPFANITSGGGSLSSGQQGTITWTVTGYSVDTCYVYNASNNNSVASISSNSWSGPYPLPVYDTMSWTTPPLFSSTSYYVRCVNNGLITVWGPPSSTVTYTVSAPYASPYSSPYGTPYGTPYAYPYPYPTPYGTPYGYPTPSVPYGTPYGYPTPSVPYGTPYVSPYSTPYSTPSYPTPYVSPYSTPYLTPYATPYPTPNILKICENSCSSGSYVWGSPGAPGTVPLTHPSTRNIVACDNPATACTDASGNITGTAGWSTSGSGVSLSGGNPRTVTTTGRGFATVTASNSSGQNATANITITCTAPSPCAADPRSILTCVGTTFTAVDFCGDSWTCQGSRTCDFNWKEVAL